MTAKSSRAVCGIAAALSFSMLARVGNAQNFVGPTRQYYASGCASGQVAADPNGVPIQGTVVCAQGTGLLGYSRASSLTFLTLRLDLAFTPGPSYPPNGIIVPQGMDVRIRYSGTGCTTGPVCTGVAQAGSFFTYFFPHVTSVGSVDLAAVDFTQARIFFEYTLPTAPGGGTYNAQSDLQLSAVPEPSALVLTLGGLGVFGAVVRRRKRASL